MGKLRYRAYGETRYTSGTTPTSFRYTGQREESSLGLYLMGARWYDPALSRWLSPDTLVPGTAESSGGGAATLGYDDQVRLTPLTVGFHETQFLAVVGEENREIAAKGFWFQRSEEEKGRSKYQWGPQNPQALNRYAYCLGNPLRYVDLSGHSEIGTVEFTLDELAALINLIQDLKLYNAGGAVLSELAGLGLDAFGFLPAGLALNFLGVVLSLDAVQLEFLENYLEDSLEAAKAQGLTTVTIYVYYDDDRWWSPLGVTIQASNLDTGNWIGGSAAIEALIAIFSPEELSSILESWFE